MALKGSTVLAYEALRAQPQTLSRVLTQLGVPLPHVIHSTLHKLHSAPIDAYVANAEELRRTNISQHDYQSTSCREDSDDRICFLSVLGGTHSVLEPETA
jgi:hypothetical protein